MQRNDIRLASQHHIMRVTLLQTDITWASPDANRENVNGLLASNEGSDLYVLPEMWTTGFATVPEGIAESEGKSLEWMKANKLTELDCSHGVYAMTHSDINRIVQKYFNTNLEESDFYSLGLMLLEKLKIKIKKKFILVSFATVVV